MNIADNAKVMPSTCRCSFCNRLLKVKGEMATFIDKKSGGYYRKQVKNWTRTKTGKPMKTHHKTDATDKMKFENQIEQPQFERHRRSWATLKWFDGTPKNEEAFYLRFQDLPDEDVTFLKSFYNIIEDRDLFEMICRFWSVPLISRC